MVMINRNTFSIRSLTMKSSKNSLVKSFQNILQDIQFHIFFLHLQQMYSAFFAFVYSNSRYILYSILYSIMKNFPMHLGKLIVVPILNYIMKNTIHFPKYILAIVILSYEISVFLPITFEN